MTTNYLKLPISLIENKNNFFNSSRLKEAPKLRNLCNSARTLFSVSDSYVNLFLVGDLGIYRIDIHNNTVKKELLGSIYYIPGENKLDIYDDLNDPSPLISFVGKRCAYMKTSVLVGKLGFEKLFSRLLSGI